MLSIRENLLIVVQSAFDFEFGLFLINVVINLCCSSEFRESGVKLIISNHTSQTPLPKYSQIIFFLSLSVFTFFSLSLSSL